MLCKADYFLTPNEQRQKEELGELMLRCYVRLASKAVRDGEFLFRTRPKMHILHHIVLSKRKLNPFKVVSCWMDEDGVKRWMRVAKGTRKRTLATNVLKRFLLGLRTRLKEASRELSSKNHRATN